jgi:hypothetical protein
MLVFRASHGLPLLTDVGDNEQRMEPAVAVAAALAMTKAAAVNCERK